MVAPPKTGAEYQRDILDRRHWNSGGRGKLLGEMPGPAGHPNPRVIVNIDRSRGPHSAKQLQRLARMRLWKPIIGCYRLGAYKDPNLRGWTRARFTVSRSGRALKPRLIKTELEDRTVTQCLVQRLADLRFSRARRHSTVWIAMRVGPGDDPLPPPKDLIIPGDGTLPLGAMSKGVEAGLGSFEACYRDAFSYAPGLWGRLVVRFHVTQQGVLDEVFESGSRFPDLRVRQCVVREARKLHFPSPKGGDIRFVVPMRLWSDQADTARAETEAAKER